MTELQQALALEGSLEYEGVVYRFGGTTLEVMARWEDWLADETLQRMERLLARKPDGAQQAMRIVADQSAEGVFDFYGATSSRRMRELSGLKKLVFFRIAQNHPDVQKKVVDAIVERDWEVIYREIQKEFAALEALLPNADAPETGASRSESAGGPRSPRSATSSTSSPPTSESAG